MSPTLTYESPIFKFLIKKGRNNQYLKSANNFVELDNSQNLNKFIDLINEAIGELNTKNNKEVADNPNSLMSLLASINANNYVNSKINENEAKKQTEQTCYANAIADTICFCSARVLGWKELVFYEVREKIIAKYGNNGNLISVLNNILGLYRLFYKQVEEEGARKPIMKTRSC